MRQHLHYFLACYAAEAYGAAVDILANALKADPGNAFRVFITTASAQVTEALLRTRRADEFVGVLGPLIANHPHVNVLAGTDAEIQRLVALRQSNIDKGLPSPIVATQAKSASVSVARIFNWGFDLPTWAYSLTTLRVIPEWASDYARGGACYCTHLEPNPGTAARLRAAGVDRLIVHTRDPRQGVVSLAHHYHRYRDQFVGAAARDGEPAILGIGKTRFMADYQSRVAWIAGWIDLSEEIEIMFSTFEDYVTDRDRFIDRYLAFYNMPTKHFDRELATAAPEGVDLHFRSGRTDEWRHALEPDVQAELNSALPEEIAARFNWPL